MKIYKKYPIIRQAGSIIQQNFGEPVLGHGFSIWDVKSKTYEHFEIKNEMSHVTLNVSNGKFKESLSNLPKTPRVRVFYENTSPTELKELFVELMKYCTPIEIIPFKTQSEKNKISDVDTGGNVGGVIKELSDVEYQNSLIKEFYKNEPSVSEELLKEIFEINKSVNSRLENYVSPVEINWTPRKLTFSNMFSYGENNTIVFDSLEGIVGVFAKNRTGKSSIMNVVSYCLFDKCPPTDETIKVLNSRCSSMSVKFEFSIGNKNYYVERTCEKDRKGNVPVKTKFKQILDDGTIKNLEGESRAQTNSIIRKYVGTYDDFILTALSIQGSKAKNLIDLGQAERKELLSKFTGLDIYEKLNKIVSEEAKEIATKVKLFKADSFETELVQLKSEIVVREEKRIELKSKLEQIDSDITSATEKIETESKKIKQVVVEQYGLDILEKRLKTLIEEKESDVKRLESLKQKLGVLENQKIELESEIRGLDLDKIKKEKQLNEERKTSLQEVEKKLNVLRVNVKNKIDKVKHLDSHKYDPNCKFCVDNDFVRDAMAAKNELEDDKIKGKELLTKEQEIKSSINDDADKRYEIYLELKTKFTGLVSSINTLSSQISGISIEKNDVGIEKTKNSIQNIKNNQDIINFNQLIEKNIANLKIERQNFQNEKRKIEYDNGENNSRISVLNSKLGEITKKIDDIKKIEFKANAYSNYVKCVSKDGISLSLLTSLLPKIEDETNEILSKITTFKLKIAVDDGDININIVENGSVWPIEMGSGMEKFISSVATRIGLINVSKIPKPSFIVIDEGFGTLDDESISSIPALFSYLRHEFNFILVISHSDLIKDFVDDVIDIVKDNGFSHVEYK
jgi:DNA repair exonuclease SbcCD ATPase subunit